MQRRRWGTNRSATGQTSGKHLHRVARCRIRRPPCTFWRPWFRSPGLQANATLPIAKFFTGPKRTALSTGEIVTGLVLPQPQESTIGAFEKQSRRQAGDLSIVSVAALAAPGSGTTSWRLALGAVSPTPLRAPESEAILDEGLTDESIDRAAAAAYGCCCPIGDIRSGEEYRQAMVDEPHATRHPDRDGPDGRGPVGLTGRYRCSTRSH